MTTRIHAPTLTVPGPRPAPILGTYGNVILFFNDPIGYTRGLFQTYGTVVALAAGGGTRVYSPHLDCPGTVFAYGPDLAREVASQHDVYHKYPVSLTLYPLGEVSPRKASLKRFGVGLLGVNGAEHRQHRRLLMPAFHKKRIEAYRDDMVAITRQVLDGWRVGERRNVAKDMRLLAARISTKTLFGEDVSEQAGSIGPIIRDSLELLASAGTLLFPFDLPGLPYHRLLNIIGQHDADMRAMIARKRALGSDTSDMLSLLIKVRDEDGTALTEDELIGHTSVIFGGGYETTATSLAWTLFLLTQHPHIAADVLNELESVLGGEAPTVEQLDELPLLERVVKESLRVIPPGTWNARVTSQPTELGGYALPPGTEVLVSIYQTHHMPELYPQPEKFDPDRWGSISPTVFEYTPFSAGSRMCIGATFAMMEMKIVLAILLQRYRLQLVHRAKVDRFGAIVTKPKYGIPVVVHTQDRQFRHGVGGVRGNVREMVDLPA